MLAALSGISNIAPKILSAKHPPAEGGSDEPEKEEPGNGVARSGDEEVVDAHPVSPPEPRPYSARRLDAHLQESRYASPLPSPDDLERYKELLPDAPERLLAAGEREQTHRHQIENRLAAIDEEAMPKFYAGQRLGQIISAVVALGYEGIMAFAIAEGHTLEGIVGAAFGIGAMVWAIRRDSKSDMAGPAQPVATDNAENTSSDQST